MNIDLEKIRLSEIYGDDISVEEVTTEIRVGKPKKQTFFRVHPKNEMRIDTALLQFDEDKQWYLVGNELMPHVIEEVSPVKIVTCIDIYGEIFLWPIKLSHLSKRDNPWNITAMAAADLGTKCWVRLVPDMKRGKYRIQKAVAELPEPEWCEDSLQDLFNKAFGEYQINSLDHPVIKKLRGQL